MIRLLAVFFLALFIHSCAEQEPKKKELSGPHAEIQLFITNSFSTSIAGDDSLHIYPIPKDHSVNDYYTIVMKSDTLLRKVLQKLNRKGTAEEVEAIRENLKFFTVKNTQILQIELYFEEEKFSCAFLDSLVETFNIDVLTQLNESSRRKIEMITAQIDTVAAKLHQIEELMMGDHEILNLERESEEYFKEYVEMEKKKNYLKKIKDCLSKEFALCIEGAKNISLEEDRFLYASLNKLHNLNVKKQNLQCPTAGNESCKKLDEEIGELVANLNIYLNNTLKALDHQLELYQSKMKTLPKTEREISRELDVNQKMYTYLLEKKTELMISRAGIISPIKLIDRARWARK